MWTDPDGTTPSIVQIDFGPWGQDVPGDGYAYCGPTSMVMGLYYLYANGFTQLAPGPFVNQDDSATVNLERIIAGLCRTSISGGTSANGLQHGIAHYLSACGISPSQYAYTSTGNPDLSWLAEQLSPNVAANPATIVLANFAVGWFSGTPPTLSNNGGHVLAPLTVDLSGGTVTLNNAFPASFEHVPNVPSKKPQTVQIEAVPPGWARQNLSLPSQDYTQVFSQTQGSGESYAILWGGQAWAIAASAAAKAPNYSPRAWRIERVVGTLFLSGGTVEGNLNTATIGEANPAPGSILQGGGTLSGIASVNGIINSGPLMGLLTFTNDVTIAGVASFIWTPQSLVDNSNSAPGEGWNGLVFKTQESNVGADGQYVSFCLDFSRVGGDPDDGDPFWSREHEWTLFDFAAKGGSCWWGPQNFSYGRGNFGLKWQGWTVCLTWTPAKTPQSLIDRRRTEAAERAAPQAGRPDA